MNLLRASNAQNLQDFLEHFELTLLCILHPRYNSIPAENRMGDTLTLKITDKVLYIQHLDRSRYDSTDLFRFTTPFTLHFGMTLAGMTIYDQHTVCFRLSCKILSQTTSLLKTGKTINMKFAQDSQDEGYVITAYGENSVSINGKPFQQSLIITRTKLDENWGVSMVELLRAEHIDQILSFKPELIIIGTGDKLIFPAVEIYAGIIEHGIGVDFMDTRAACRTYNILMSENRHVVAGLIM